jgi:hypothetical protein
MSGGSSRGVSATLGPEPLGLIVASAPPDAGSGTTPLAPAAWIGATAAGSGGEGRGAAYAAVALAA